MLSEFIHSFITSLNNVRSNVWSVILIGAGILLIVHGHDRAGESLLTGAFAVFRSSNTNTAPVPLNAAHPPEHVVGAAENEEEEED